MRSSRNFKRILSILTAALISAALLSSCGPVSDKEDESSQAADENSLVIGIVVPDSGDYSYYSLGTEYIMEEIAENFYNETGINLVYYISQDYDGSKSAAAGIVEELVNENGAQIIIASHGDENVCAVSAACERLGVLCVSSDCDLDSWLDSGPYENSFCISYSLAGRLYALSSIWSNVSDSPVVGVLIGEKSAADDVLDIYDDIAYDTGATIIDPGRFKEGQTDYSNIISALETAGCEIITGIMSADDFAVFIKQADEAEYYPEIIAVADGVLFEHDALSLGSLSDGLYTDVSVSSEYTADNEGAYISAAALESIFKENYSVSAPQSAGLFASAVQTALSAALNAESYDTDDMALYLKENTTQTLAGEVSFDEEGGFLIASEPGIWSYDTENDTCTLSIVEEE